MLAFRIDDLRGVSGEAQSEITKRPLYSPLAHWTTRIGLGSMSVLFLGAALGIAKSFVEEKAPLGLVAAGILVMSFCALLLATHLRTSALYGSFEGLEVARWGKRRVVPWATVGAAEYAWWSNSRVGRIATVTIQAEKGRTILFFANDRVLEDFETMRSLYTRS